MVYADDSFDDDSSDLESGMVVVLRRRLTRRRRRLIMTCLSVIQEKAQRILSKLITNSHRLTSGKVTLKMVA
jgi:hypothetical protein